MASEQFAAWAAPDSPAVANVIRSRLIDGRKLDFGNAQPGALGSDFGRFGFQLWPALSNRTAKSGVLNATLDRLNRARNAIAHADYGSLLELRADGFPITLRTFRTWRSHLNLLATNLDREVAFQLGFLFGEPDPW